MSIAAPDTTRASRLACAIGTVWLAVAASSAPAMAQGSGGSSDTAPGQNATAVIRDIRAIRHPGGTDKWDAAVKPILLAAYDTDRSGSIDTVAEVTAISCDLLKVLDEVIRPFDNGQSALTWTYGFKPGNYTYLGDALGFATSMRNPAFERMRTCGVRTGA